MAWLEDSVEEFKKLPTWGKIAAGGALVAVGGLAYYEKTKSASTASTTAATGSTNGSLLPASGAVDANGNPVSTSIPTGTIGGPGSPILVTGPVGATGPAGAPGKVGATGPAGKPVVAPTTKPVAGKPKPVHPPTPKLSSYTVVHGDSLSSIAARLHVQGGWQALYNENKGVVGSNPNQIKPGQKLNTSGLVH